MSITAAQIKQLRGKTGAGILDCKNALGATEGDFEKAIDWLRTKGIAKAAKKASRAASEGAVFSYIHGAGRIGVLLEVNCETDFVSRGDVFQGFVKDVAMHIAAAEPRWISRADAPSAEVDREKAIFLQQAIDSGKPDHIAEKMVTGKLNKFFATNCLMEQGWVRDDDQTIEQLQTSIVTKTGENVRIRRFIRWNLGEGLERKSDDFVAEVAAMAAAN
jgi:elongation factor Ts